MSLLEISVQPKSFAGWKNILKFKSGIYHFIIFRDVAEIIKKHIPDTYAVVETMESAEFGSLPVKKAKGEGGQSDLATRIGNNYYNDYLRYTKLQIFFEYEVWGDKKV